MNSFLFAINAVSPIIIMVAIGYVIKKLGLITPDFAKLANKLVFRLFLPAMLFLNIYNIDNITSISFGYVLYAVAALLIIFAIAVCAVVFFTKDGARRGALLQNTFRSNFALVGMPLSISLFGDAGGAAASVLSAFSIPIFNALAVVSLSIFRKNGEKLKIRSIFMNIVKNPLIQAVLSGIFVLLIRQIFMNYNLDFRLSDITPLFKALGYLSNVATPLALIVLGAQFEFSAITALKKEIIFGVITRNIIVPVLCLGVAYVFFRDAFSGAHFAAYVALFATPVAVSSVPMAQEMDSDATLAGQLVVWTTLVSAVTIFVYTYLLSLLGIFPAG